MEYNKVASAVTELDIELYLELNLNYDLNKFSE